MQSSKPETLIKGRLKWFDRRNEFGFIVDSVSHCDVLLTLDSVADFGWETVADGSLIECYAFETERGLQVSEIVKIVPPSELGDFRLPGSEPVELLSADYIPARVRWYNNELGYGFVRAHGDTEDCFLHWSTLKEAGRLTVDTGEAVEIRMGRNGHGKIAAGMRPWQGAQSSEQNPIGARLMYAA